MSIFSAAKFALWAEVCICIGDIFDFQIELSLFSEYLARVSLYYFVKQRIPRHFYLNPDFRPKISGKLFGGIKKAVLQDCFKNPFI
jgi:hypothetical protein